MTPASVERTDRSTDQALELTIMIPAYLEAASLRDLLPLVKAKVMLLTPSFEILVIDTQDPKDDTSAVCALHQVRHIHRSGGNQYGDAIRTGIAAARGRYVLCMDADGSHSPDYFESMWTKRKAWDITIGSRYVEGGHTENPAILIWMSYLVNLTFRLAFNIHAKDVTNSFRLYRSETIKPIKLESNDFDILEELLIKAVTHRPAARIGEVPVTFARRKAGTSKRKLAQFALGYLKTLQKLRRFQNAARMEMETK
jgi:dolichol-phosphate mannosyltransferase